RPTRWRSVRLRANCAASAACCQTARTACGRSRSRRRSCRQLTRGAVWRCRLSPLIREIAPESLTPLSQMEREERPRPGLFHRDGLGEIARLVDVTPALDGAVIGEELERDHGRDGLQEIEVVRGINDVVRDLSDLLIAFGGDGDHLSAAT